MTWKGARALVTGGTGTIGSAVVRRLLGDGADVVRVFSRDDTKQYELERVLGGDPRVRFLIGDVRDRDRLVRACEDIDLIVHAAALKHVGAAEYNPFEAVDTNVRGTQNVIDAALAHNTSRLVLVSTDKVVAPIGVYGATKLLAERIVAAARQFQGSHECTFAAVRFGNVIWSRGSLVPSLLSDLRVGRPLTITDPKMTRFFMSIDEAVGLIARATDRASGGETFVAKMPGATVGDVAEAVVQEFADGGRPRLSIVGRRAGEREHELLLSSEEAPFARETDDGWVLGPDQVPGASRKEYSSNAAPRLSIDELRELLRTSRPPIF